MGLRGWGKDDVTAKKMMERKKIGFGVGLGSFDPRSNWLKFHQVCLFLLPQS